MSGSTYTRKLAHLAVGVVATFTLGTTLNWSATVTAAAGPLPLTGVNLSGGEWSIRPENGTNYYYPTQAEVDYFAGQGMNCFRYPFRWETLQPETRMPLDRNALASLKASVKFATAQKLVVILDPHNSARYGTNIVGASKISAGDFADFWARLAVEFKDDTNVWFGLVNEPHDMPTRLWFADANAAMAAIRATGAKNMILVPGNNWTGAHSWMSGGDESNAKWALTIKDPLNRWAIEVHQYVDRDSSGTHDEVVSPTIGPERLKNFVGWCRRNRLRAMLCELGVPAVPAGEETVHNMLGSMERDSDVWLGWAWWAAGSRWGDYMFTIEPKPDGTERSQIAWLRPHLNGAEVRKK